MKNMIDHTLLKKISGDDQAFERQITQRIYAKAVEFGKNFRKSAVSGEWNSCYYQLLEFYKSITPYARMSYLNEMSQQISVISYTHDDQVKRTTCVGVLKGLEVQLEVLRQPEPVVMERQSA